jgi:hypothetical protein
MGCEKLDKIELETTSLAFRRPPRTRELAATAQEVSQKQKKGPPHSLCMCNLLSSPCDTLTRTVYPVAPAMRTSLAMTSIPSGSAGELADSADKMRAASRVLCRTRYPTALFICSPRSSAAVRTTSRGGAVPPVLRLLDNSSDPPSWVPGSAFWGSEAPTGNSSWDSPLVFFWGI